jgi:tetratricopeptide (TPR) repeat protein
LKKFQSLPTTQLLKQDCSKLFQNNFEKFLLAIALNPNLTVVYNNRDNLYQTQGRLELALADYNKAIAIDSNYALAYGNLGLLYQKMGNPEAARTNLQKAQELFISQGRTADAEKAANLLQQLP